MPLHQRARLGLLQLLLLASQPESTPCSARTHALSAHQGLCHHLQHRG